MKIRLKNKFSKYGAIICHINHYKTIDQAQMLKNMKWDCAKRIHTKEQTKLQKN